MDGRPFGRYRLIELLGRGGMGEVWRAHDTATDRIVALKLLPPQLADDEIFQERFRREAHAAARLNEPHIVPIHSYGEIEGRLYVDMRLIDGRDLQTVLADGPLPPPRAVMIIEQIAKALQAAHVVGLVHRDIKPSNILIAEFDFAYLIDFGIARGINQTGITDTGSMIGTWHYMAPERLSDGVTDSRSDIYALACVLHECLTGHRPFPGDTVERQVTAHLMTPPPRPSSTNPTVPVAFDPVIATGMAKDPNQRYATTMELAHAAQDAITTPIARPSSPPAPEQEATGIAPVSPGGLRSHSTQPGYAALFASAPTQSAQPVQIAPEPARRGPTTAVMLAIVGLALFVAGGLIFVGMRFSHSQQSAPSTVTVGPRLQEPTLPATTAPTTQQTGMTSQTKVTSVPPSPSSRSSTALSGASFGDLGLSIPMSRPACDGEGIVVLGNATTPVTYAADVQRLLDRFPGSSYLRTDQACPSLRQSLNGNPIYAVYRVAGPTEADICAGVRAAGGDAYGKWLDMSTDPNSYIRQSCFR